VSVEQLTVFERRQRLAQERERQAQLIRILRIALEAIYGTPALTLAEARAIAGQALEDTE
jgi:hypothetical protein